MFPHDCQNWFYVFRWSSWGKKVLLVNKLYIFCHCWILSKTDLFIVGKILTSLSKLHFICSEKHFEDFFAGNLCFFFLWSLIEKCSNFHRKNLRNLWKIPWNGFLCFQINTLRKKVFRNFCFFCFFFSFSDFDRKSCGWFSNNFNRVVKTAFSLSSGTFRRQNALFEKILSFFHFETVVERKSLNFCREKFPQLCQNGILAI